MNYPVKIKVLNKDFLRIEWNDGVTYDYPVKYLRDESPAEAEVGKQELKFPDLEKLRVPEEDPKYKIEKIEVVGNYAIQIYWGDGTYDGIYSFELLRKWGKYFSVIGDLHQDFDHHH